MGEYADMILDGLIDSETGELIDGHAPGYPRRRWKGKPRCGEGNERCPQCGKRFKTQEGVKDHTAEVHSGRPKLKMRKIVERIAAESKARRQ